MTSNTESIIAGVILPEITTVSHRCLFLGSSILPSSAIIWLFTLHTGAYIFVYNLSKNHRFKIPTLFCWGLNQLCVYKNNMLVYNMLCVVFFTPSFYSIQQKCIQLHPIYLHSFISSNPIIKPETNKGSKW